MGRLGRSVSGSWVVACSGTVGSTRLPNSPMSGAARSASCDGEVMARLEAAVLPGLIGCAYW
ncbi:MAG: hypothetical protein H7345_15485 [Rubritepida sp.]|nr:hypothetical protein [Rubritepida sp.]